MSCMGRNYTEGGTEQMGLLKKTPEEQAAKAELKRQKQFEKNVKAFWDSPAGRARSAFDQGDHVFQYHIDVLSQDAVIVAMIGSTTSKRRVDPAAVVNSVCHEGWELVNGDFVFVMTGQQSRDKFMSSGQNVAVAGTVMGYYLFKRREANRRDESEDELLARLAPGAPPRASTATRPPADTSDLVSQVEQARRE